MQAPNIRNKYHLRRFQIILVLLLSIGYTAFGQNRNHDNLADYDEQWIHYGFLMGIHNSSYRINYSDEFTSFAMDSVHSIIPAKRGGFKLGFIVNMYLFQFLDFRILPTVGFYEYEMQYRFTDGRVISDLKDVTMMEVPLLFKYKSQRRGNIAMYLVGGINPQFEAAGRGDEASEEENLKLTNFNLAVDVGMGFDLYFPLFKFSPEIRYSHGLVNLLTSKQNSYNVNLDRLVTHNFTFLITFEGGPNYLKRRKKKWKAGENPDG